MSCQLCCLRRWDTRLFCNRAKKGRSSTAVLQSEVADQSPILEKKGLRRSGDEGRKENPTKDPERGSNTFPGKEASNNVLPRIAQTGSLGAASGCRQTGETRGGRKREAGCIVSQRTQSGSPEQAGRVTGMDMLEANQEIETRQSNPAVHVRGSKRTNPSDSGGVPAARLYQRGIQTTNPQSEANSKRKE